MAEEIKDLGGLVNKDIAFSKVKEDVVYDSENFRITSDEGGTFAVRTVIKGNTKILTVPSIPCKNQITIDTNSISSLLVGYDYSIDFLYGIDTLTFTFNYSTVPVLLTELTAFLNTNTTLNADSVTASTNGTNSITVLIPSCATLSVSQVYIGTVPSAPVSFPYDINNPIFTIANDPGDPTQGYNALMVGADGINTSLFPFYAPSDSYWNTDVTTSITTPYTFTTDIGSSIYDSALSTLISKGQRLAYIESGATDNSRTIFFNAPITQTAYNLDPTAYVAGDITFDFEYYIGKFSVSSGTFLTKNIKVLAEFSGPVTGATYVNYTNTTVVSTYLNLVEIYSDTIVESTDHLGVNKISISYNVPDNGVRPLRYVVVLDIEPNTHGATWDLEFFMTSFKVAGPWVAPSFISNSLVSVGVTNPRIIGWTCLRDKSQDNLYLFTTSSSMNPDDSSTWGGSSIPNTDGQIWKLSYDKAGNHADSSNYTISLIYNSDKLNFTRYRPIANPGMIESRYENEYIQKIYWTDNYNVPRVINVADPNAQGLSIEDLNLQPSLSMDLPIVTQIVDGGNLLVGVYQIAYRLKNTNGAESRFSRTSNLIPIIDAAEDQYYQYFPIAKVGEAANKSIRVEVNNLDTSFDTIEFVTLYYSDDFTPPVINIVKESYIPENGKVDVIISGGDATAVVLTVDEFTAFASNIKKAKTLAAKKQTLFLANVTLGTQILDFDARTYRFPANSVTTIIKANDSNIQYEIDANYQVTRESYDGGLNWTSVTPYNIPSNFDCIQLYEDQGPELASNTLYQPNSNVIGGKGPNISYEFITEQVVLDSKYDTAAPAYAPHLVADQNVTITFNSIDRTYTSKGGSLSNYASPYAYDIFVGYRRDELERFGIVFFDELDNPTYVNWIGDIRMPHVFMPVDSAGALYPAGTNRCTINSSTFHSNIVDYNTTTHKLTGNPLGIKFTIDFSSVADKYKKAMIVRVPKKDEDKHILGQGIFLPSYKTEGVAPFPEEVYLSRGLWNTDTDGYSAGNNNYWFDCWSLHSPEFLFKGFNGPASLDSIDVIGLYTGVGASWLGDQKAAGEWFTLDDSSGYTINSTEFTGYKTKLYTLLEDAGSFPYVIKNTNSTNPYPVQRASSILAGGAGRAYDTGLSADYNVSTTRRVYNSSPRDMSASNGGGLGSDFNQYSFGSKALFVELEENSAWNWQSSAVSGGEYLDERYSFGGDYSNYIANYKRQVASPFGGQDYFSRANSEYISCNSLIDISNKVAPISTKIFGGDTIISVMDHCVQFFDASEAFRFGGSAVGVLTVWVYFPCETTIGIDYRRNTNNLDAYKNAGTEVPNRSDRPGIPGDAGDAGWYDGSSRMAVRENFEVDSVFNHTDKSAYRYFAAPALGQATDIYDCRIWKSEPKVDGELVESWSIFRPGAYKDVESAYGPINNLIIFQDKMFYFQDRAFGVAQVDEQKLIQNADNTISDLVLGSSGILERYDYISTKTGTKHQFSMSVSDYSILWFDVLARKMYRYNPKALEPVSDIKGYNAYLYNRVVGTIQTTDNPYISEGIHSTYDFRHNEFYMTFVHADDGFYTTLVYNDLLDGFVGSYTHYPVVYINDKLNIFSTNPNSPFEEQLFIHNYGDYGRFYNSRNPSPAKLSFILNSTSSIEKVLTNIEFIAEGRLHVDSVNYPFSSYDQNDPHYYDALGTPNHYLFFDVMRVTNNYQNTDWFNLITNTIDYSSRNNYARRHKTIWNTRMPSDRVLDTTQNIFDPANLSQIKPRLTRRLKDKWFMVDLLYNNSLNADGTSNKFSVHSAKAIYSINSR